MSIVIGLEEPVQPNECLFELKPVNHAVTHWRHRYAKANRYSIIWTGDESKSRNLFDLVAGATVNPGDRYWLLTWWRRDTNGLGHAYYEVLSRRRENVANNSNLCIWAKPLDTVHVPTADEQRPRTISVLVTGMSHLDSNGLIESCDATLDACLALGRFELSLQLLHWMSQRTLSLLWRRADDVGNRGLVIITPKRCTIDWKSIGEGTPTVYVGAKASLAWRQGAGRE